MRRKGLLRLIAVASVATVIGFASPGFADGTTYPIHDTQIPTTAKAFDQDCTGPFEDLDTNQDGWHFVTTGTASFISVTLKFHTPGGDVTVVIDSTDSSSPNTGTGWKGWLDNAGSNEKHAYLITDAGWTLFYGSAQETGDSATDFFNLSHTCAGTPTSPSPQPSASASTDPGSPTPSSSEGGRLPKTGEAITTIALSGLAAIVAGAGVLFILRRRREALMSSSDE